MAAWWSRIGNWSRAQLLVVLPVVGVGLIGCSLSVFWLARRPSGEIELRFSAGRSFTRCHEIGCSLAQSAAAQGLRMEVVDSAGTVECLERVNDGDLDVAVIPGGIKTDDYPRVRQIACLGESALHCLVKPECLKTGAEGLEVVRGCRVNVGEPGSGEFALGSELLEFAGLRPIDAAGEGDYLQTNLGRTELLARARAIQVAPPENREPLIDELPDVVLMESALPSRITQALMAAADYQLLPLPYSRAFTQDHVVHLGRDARKVDRWHVEQTVIPAFTYRVSPPVPAADCETLGVKLLVLAHEDLGKEASRRLLASIYTGPFAHAMRPPDLLEIGSEYPLLAAAQTYLEGRKPLHMNDFIEALQNLLSAFGAFSAGVLALYGYYRAKRGRRPEQFIEAIGKIESLARGQVAVDQLPRETQLRSGDLEERLSQLKQQVLQEYTAGRLRGETSLTSILTLIADTRQSLLRGRKPTPPVALESVTPRRRSDSPPAATAGSTLLFKKAG